MYASLFLTRLCICARVQGSGPALPLCPCAKVGRSSRSHGRIYSWRDSKPLHRESQGKKDISPRRGGWCRRGAGTEQDFSGLQIEFTLKEHSSDVLLRSVPIFQEINTEMNVLKRAKGMSLCKRDAESFVLLGTCSAQYWPAWYLLVLS